MFGHSRGGAATIDTMFHDARISAGVSLDTGSVLFTGDNGLPPSDVVTAELDRPLGLMCSLDEPCSSPQLVDFATRLRGPHPMRQLPILHNGYTDFVVFNAQAERVDPAVAAWRRDPQMFWLALAFVDFSSVPKCHDRHEKYVVRNGVDDAVVTDANAQTCATLQRPGCRWSWVLREQGDRSLDATANLGVKLAKSPDCGRPEFDTICAHAQPRSTLTCSQGMLGPSSSIAASKSATS